MAQKELVPIKIAVRYGPKFNGEVGHIYPNFNLVTTSKRGNMDWSHFFKIHGFGPLSDKVSGIGESDAVNPDPEIWYNYALVPKDFADEAEILFPEDVTQLTEVEFEADYNTRCTAHLFDIKTDDGALQYVDLLLRTGVSVDDPRITKALDPNDDTPGVRWLPNKTWERIKAKKGFKIHASKAKNPS